MSGSSDADEEAAAGDRPGAGNSPGSGPAREDGPDVVSIRDSQGIQIGDRTTQINYNSATFVTPDGIATRSTSRTVTGYIESPYRGLSAFDEQHALFFFGRKAAADDILRRLGDRLANPGILVVSGVSGAGKSSLLKAGVLPRIAEAGLADIPGKSPWTRMVLTPTSAPVRELATHISSVTDGNAAALARDLSEHPSDLPDAIRVAALRNGRGRLLLIIDQFEQVFTQCQDEKERKGFIAALHAAATAEVGPAGESVALVVLVVRADFEARCLEYDELADAVDERYLVRPMTEAELRQAITGPAELARGAVSNPLVELLVQAVRPKSPRAPALPGAATIAGVLPHLSHVLDQAWRSRAASGELTIADYERAGGIEGSIAASAALAYGGLTRSQQVVAQSVFMRLVTTSSDLVVSAARATEDELRQTSPAEDVDAVLGAFASQRLLTFGDGYVEISHEVLLTAWEQLRTWLDGDRSAMAHYSRLVADARDWDKNNRSATYLYAAGRLGEIASAIKEWADAPGRYPLGGATGQFLSWSQRAARRGRLRRRGLVAAVTTLVIVAGAVGIFARLQTANASRQRTIALSSTLLSEAISQEATDPVLARQLVVAAWYESRSQSQVTPAITTLLTQQQEAGELPASPGVGVRSVAFSPDGTLLASAGASVRLWSAANGQAVGNPMLPYPASSTVDSVAFSPKGNLIASGDDGGYLQVWRSSGVPAARPMRPADLAPSQAGRVTSVAFSPDGSLLAVADTAGFVTFWDTTTWKVSSEIRPLPAYGGNPELSSVAFSPRGRIFATASAAGNVTLWNLATGKPVSSPLLPDPNSRTSGVNCVAFSPDGTLLATAGDDGNVRFWNSLTGAPIGKPLEVNFHEDFGAIAFGVSAIAFSRDGTLLATTNLSGTVQTWSVAARKLVMSSLPTGGDLNVSQHANGALVMSSNIAGLAFNPRVNEIAAGDTDGFVRLWNTENMQPVGSPIKMGTVSGPMTIRFSATGGLLSGPSDGYAEQAPETPVPGPDEWTAGSTVAISRDHKVLTGVVAGGYLGIWVVHAATYSYKRLSIPLATPPGRLGVSFSPDGRLIVGVGADGKVRLWDSESGSLARTFGPIDDGVHQSFVTAIFSPDGQTVATAGENDVVQLWNPKNGKLRGTLRPVNTGIKLRGIPPVLAFSPDGKQLAVGYDNGRIQLWNSTSHTPSGQPLVDASTIGTSIADSNSGAQNSLNLNPPITGLFFDSGGGLLLSMDATGNVIPWQLRQLEHPYDTLCDEVGPPSAAAWKQYANGAPEPAGICAGVLPASALYG